MNIADIFKKKTVFSFEVFPPKKESGVETVYNTLRELKDLNPDFISVTYGAGGSGIAKATTVDLCAKIKTKKNIFREFQNSILKIMNVRERRNYGIPDWN